MSKGLTTRELARLLGISASTLRIWEDVLQLPVPRDEQNHRRYPPALVITLISVARLRQAGQDYAAIAKELQIGEEATAPAEVAVEDVAPPEPEAAPVDKVVGRPIEAAREPLTPTVLAKDHPDLFTAYTRLGEDHRNLSARYAEATFTIGQLEERVHHLTQQLVDAETRLANYELDPPQPLALPPAPEPAATEALRDLEDQVRMLALAMISHRPLSAWERFTLWLKG